MNMIKATVCLHFLLLFKLYLQPKHQCFTSFTISDTLIIMNSFVSGLQATPKQNGIYHYFTEERQHTYLVADVSVYL